MAVRSGVTLNRREFVCAAVGGGLMLGFRLPLLARAVTPEAPDETVLQPNAWVRIHSDDTVLIRIGSSEMGQGVLTAIPMLVAEELDCDWARVRSGTGPADAAFRNPLIGAQVTGGSTAVRGYWTIARRAGAVAREMLVTAAARRWGVPVESCRTAKGQVIHEPSGRRLRYGALALEAAGLPIPEEVFLKDPDEFRLIGRPLPRTDTPDKVTGKARFGLDVKLPRMWTAVIERCPVFGGKLRGFDATGARKVSGVREVLAISSGVAVLAEDTWSALQGRRRLRVEWDEGPGAGLSSASLRERMRRALDSGLEAARRGDAARALARAPRRIAAEYEVPFLAHATMEPMNCTVRIDHSGCDIWVPTQAQTFSQQTAMRLTGLPAEKVRIHTTFLGGGFGRRSETDFVHEAVELALASGRPVQVVWTREDDMRHDFYRPATVNRLAAALDDAGLPVAWQHFIAGPSILARRAPGAVRNGIDGTSVEGAANLPYAIEHLDVRYALVEAGIPVGFWRSVGSSQNAFVTECFLDEVARAGGHDPLDLRLRLLRDHPRHRGVLELAAEKAGWGAPPAAGRHRGVAVAGSFGSYVAQVAEVSVEQDRVRVHRVVCAVDCGRIVNPDTIRAQMESGIVYGLTAALKGEITIRNGRVVQGNFPDYPLLTMAEMPAVEVHIVASEADPGGVGEPGTPPIAPAVANAVFAATGRPVRRLPIRLRE